jgi:CRP-like cAMP-binding protein
MMDCPNMCLDLFKYMSQIHVEAMRRLRGLLHTKAEGRVVMALLEIGRRLGIEDEDEFTISEYFTHEDIGDMVGLVRTTVSESISKLSEMGIVRREGRMLIVDRHLGEQYLQEFS